MAFNVNELIIDRVRSLTAHDLSNGEMLFRLTSLEDPSLACQAEGEEVVDAIGALITTLYRAKKATFSASNSLMSLDLAAAQFGAQKEVAAAEKKIVVPTSEIVTVEKDATEVTLKKAPVGEVKYIYALNNNEIATRYTAASAASATEFVTIIFSFEALFVVSPSNTTLKLASFAVAVALPFIVSEIFSITAYPIPRTIIATKTITNVLNPFLFFILFPPFFEII